MSVSAHSGLAPRLRALLGPAAVTLAMLAVLVALGMWQLHRRSWKLAILADIDRAEASPAISLPPHPLPFTKVSVTGRLRDDVHALYGVEVREGPRGPALGAQLIEPLERPDGDPVLVQRGWVPDGSLGAAGGPATVTGYVRTPDAPGAFSPADDLASRHFFTLDPAKIGDSLGLPHVAPFVLVALGSDAGDASPAPATALPRPANDHLNYALTWFGLALSLLAVFGAYARKALR